MSTSSAFRRRATAVVVLGAALAWSGCSGEKPPPPNIVLVSIDTLRPDHLGAYGYGRPTSPNIDRIAREGILFERAYSVTSWTLPAHLTMLTGLYPDEHGVVGDGQRLADGIELLPERLARRGYRSAAVVSGPYLNSRFGYARGWEVYDDSLVPADEIHLRSTEAASMVSSERIHRRALQLLDTLGEGPFFLFLHYFDVHYDFIPPPPWNRAFDPDYSGPVDGRVVATKLLLERSMPERDLQHLLALYDGEIAWVDHWIGELDRALAARSLDRSTLLVVTSDHGEEFFEHTFLGHRRNLFDSTLRIPLVVRLPDRRFAGARRAEPVSLVDLVPTLARVAGVKPPRAVRGGDLLHTRWGRLHPPAKGDLFASLHTSLKSLIRDRWKLIARVADNGQLDPSQLFLADLARDPDEKRNVRLADRRFTARLFLALRDATRSFGERRSTHPPMASDAAPELEKQLRALGYL